MATIAVAERPRISCQRLGNGIDASVVPFSSPIDETWLPERSAGLGERSRERSPVAFIKLPMSRGGNWINEPAVRSSTLDLLNMKHLREFEV
jgi:hypothetical protein